MNRPDLRMDLNLFRVLDAIHTHGGISAAARALHLTQPANYPCLESFARIVRRSLVRPPGQPGDSYRQSPHDHGGCAASP